MWRIRVEASGKSASLFLLVVEVETDFHRTRKLRMLISYAQMVRYRTSQKEAVLR